MAETIRELISEQDVDKRIEELGQEISRDYAGKSIHLICILKGGAFFHVRAGEADHASGVD